MTTTGVPLLASVGEVYYTFAAILGAGWVLFAVYALLQDGYERRILLVATVPAISMAIGYALMAEGFLLVETEGSEQSLARFLSYTLVLGAIGKLIKDTIDLTFRQFIKLLAILVALPWMSLVSWLVPGIWNSLLTLGSIIAYFVVTYVLFRPVGRIALDIGGKRWLLYAKLRNLLVLTWGVLVLTSAASEQALAVTDRFVAQVGAGYTDIVLMFGTPFLIISSIAVFETDQTPHDEAIEPDETPQSGSSTQVD